ncbi:hypothetical protein B0G52_109248, partial [Cohnella sp. SGD-V74]
SGHKKSSLGMASWEDYLTPMLACEGGEDLTLTQ